MSKKRIKKVSNLPSKTASQMFPTAGIYLNPKRFILAGILIIVVVLFKYLDVWNNYFDQRGVVYIVYNITRFVFILMFPCMVYAAGRILLKPSSEYGNGHDFDGIDHYLLCSFLGAGVINILMFLLGAFSLIRIEVTVPVAIALTYLASSYVDELAIVARRALRGIYGIFADKHETGSGKNVLEVISRVINFILIVFIIVAVWELLIKRGMIPHLADNDIPGTYLPSYDDIVNEAHSFWPTMWYIHYYTAKGIGLQFFGMSLTDIFSCQLVNLYLFFLSALTLVQVFRKISPNATWILFALLLFLHSPMAALPYAKNHVALGCYIIFIFYLCALTLASPEHALGGFKMALFISVVSCVLFFPLSSMFCLVLIGTAFVYAIVVKSWKKMRLFLCSAIAISLTLIGVYTFNYFQSGLLDMATSVFDRYWNHEIFSQWNSELVLVMQRFFNKGEGYANAVNLFDLNRLQASLRHVTGVIANGGAISEIWAVVIIVALAILLCVIFIDKYSVDDSINKMKSDPLAVTLILCGSAWAVVAVGLCVYVHAAMLRATSFRGFLFVILFFGMLILTIRHTISARWRPMANVIVPVILLCFVIFLKPNKLHSAAGEGSYGFLYGEKSYCDIVNVKWPMRTELYVSQNVLPGKRVVHLNFVPGAYLLPGAHFQRPLKNVYKADLPKVLYGTPAEAIAALKENGIEHVMVNLNNPLGVTALAPVFAPESLIANFRLLWQGGPKNSHFVLSMKNGKGQALDWNSQFVKGYISLCNHGHGYVYNHERLYVFGKWAIKEMGL